MCDPSGDVGWLVEDSSKTPPKKYLKINGKVSKDKWQSMFRYLAKYVNILFLCFYSTLQGWLFDELEEL